MTPDYGSTRHGEVARFQPGACTLAPGLHAWMQPNGGLGESNAGLVVGNGESLLVDTLWDLRSTAEMLEAFEALAGPNPISQVVNTHSDGDHCWGNQLVRDATIWSSRETSSQMPVDRPSSLMALSAFGHLAKPLVERLSGPGLAGSHSAASPRTAGRKPDQLPGRINGGFNAMINLAGFASELSDFDFRGVRITLPGKTFSGSHQLDVGGRLVEFIHVGPAHTEGDTIVHVPDSRAVFAGDILFIGCTPILWAGTARSWISAIDRITELNPDILIPGHGPVTDIEGALAMRRYWELIDLKVDECISSGLSNPTR